MMVRAIDDTEALQRPHGVHRCGCEANRVSVAAVDLSDKLRHNVSFAAFNQQPLCMPPPKQVVGAQSLHKLRRGSIGERLGWCTSRFFPEHTIDAPMRFVAQISDVGISLASLEPRGGWVVL